MIPLESTGYKRIFVYLPNIYKSPLGPLGHQRLPALHEDMKNIESFAVHSKTKLTTSPKPLQIHHFWIKIFKPVALACHPLLLQGCFDSTPAPCLPVLVANPNAAAEATLISRFVPVSSKNSWTHRLSMSQNLKQQWNRIKLDENLHLRHLHAFVHVPDRFCATRPLILCGGLTRKQAMMQLMEDKSRDTLGQMLFRTSGSTRHIFPQVLVKFTLPLKQKRKPNRPLASVCQEWTTSGYV